MRNSSYALRKLVPAVCATGYFLFFGMCTFAHQSSAEQATGDLAGVVRSQNGAAISDAEVQLQLQGKIILRTLDTDASGRFSISHLPVGAYQLLANAGGFQSSSMRVVISAGQVTRITVTLSLLPLEQTVVVSPTQTPEELNNVPEQITTLNQAAVNASPAVTLDDLLREIPDFSLFRRTSSLVAQPTTNGVSLRGVGASGVSRTLVFLDGIPINDPVGSWIYWAEIPSIQVRDVEVAPGGISSLYGSSAMAGVIDITTRKPKEPALALNALVGSDETAGVEYLVGNSRGRWSYSSAGSLFRTDGYVLVPEPYRGAVDVNANSQHETANARVDFQATQHTGVFVDGRFFNEHRGNGTPLQNNSTREGALNAGLRSQSNNANDWRINVFSFDQIFHSSFSAVSANRNTESLSLLQTEPSYGYGANVQWSRPVAFGNLMSAGADARWTYARDEETSFSSGTSTLGKRIPAEQILAGAFLQDFWSPSSRFSLVLGARADAWRNYDASLAQTSFATQATTVTQDPNVSRTIVTPHAGVVFHPNSSLALHGAFYQGFRAPTLDELYRGFRVGNVLTLANPNLGPERVTGYEVGLNQQLAANLFWRITAFADRLDAPVSNVTIATTPALITQQRENLGYVNVKGIEFDANYRVRPSATIDARYLFDQAVVGSFSANAAIVGNLLPQVPKNRASFSISDTGWKHIAATVEGRYESHRFDDVLNQFKLGSFFVLDTKVSSNASERWIPFIEMDNVLNRQYFFEATPTPEIGTPFMVAGGMRFQWSR